MRNCFLIYIAIGIQFVFADNGHLIKWTIDCSTKDSIKVTVSNYSSETICFHAPENVHSYYKNKHVYFVPEYSKYIEHMEGRPFSIDCLRPFKDSSVEQEYKKNYVVPNIYDKNVKNMQGFYFSVGTWNEFKFLKNFGVKNYREQVDFLNKHISNIGHQCDDQ